MSFNNQHIELENQDYKVSISYINREDGTLSIKSEDVKSGLKHEVNFKSGEGFWLTKKIEDDESQSVKIVNNKLVIALHQDLVCFKLPQLSIEWHQELDKMPIFEFLDIEDDIFLRGELQIFRIDLTGRIVWSTYGEGIWVNIEGNREMQIVNNQLVLTDFNGKKYYIDVSKTRKNSGLE